MYIEKHLVFLRLSPTFWFLTYTRLHIAGVKETSWDPYVPFTLTYLLWFSSTTSIDFTHNPQVCSTKTFYNYNRIIVNCHIWEHDKQVTRMHKHFCPNYTNRIEKYVPILWAKWWRHQIEIFSALLAICEFLHKEQWRRALIFSLICAWINGWVNDKR